MTEAAHRQQLRALGKRRFLKRLCDVSAVKRQVDSALLRNLADQETTQGSAQCRSRSALFRHALSRPILFPRRQNRQHVAKRTCRNPAFIPGDGDVIDGPLWSIGGTRITGTPGRRQVTCAMSCADCVSADHGNSARSKYRASDVAAPSAAPRTNLWFRIVFRALISQHP